MTIFSAPLRLRRRRRCREHAPAGSGDALRKAGGDVCLFSRNCKNHTDRFTSIRDAVPSLPAPSAVIDGELVACDADGMPDFFALMRRRTDGLCVWGFDLLELNGRDLRTRPLATRKDKLRDLLIAADDHTLRFSESFEDPEKLLAVADRMEHLRGRHRRKSRRSRARTRARPRRSGRFGSGQPSLGLSSMP